MDTETAGIRKYHYVITISYETGHGVSTATVGGGYGAQPGTTRTEAFNELLAYARKQAGAEASPTTCVLFFSLEPDDMAGG